MSGRRSKRKGSGYELEIAKKLSAAFAPYVFKRVPLSGGWDKSLVVGDLVPWVNDNIVFFAFSVECKNHKTLNLKAWLKQAAEDTEGKIQEPIVIFHINRRKGLPHGEDFVAIEKGTLCDFLNRSFRSTRASDGPARRIYYKDYTSSDRWSLNEWIQETFAFQTDDKIRAMFLDHEGQTVVVLRLKDFLGIIDKRRVKRKSWCALRKYLPISCFTRQKPSSF